MTLEGQVEHGPDQDDLCGGGDRDWDREEAQLGAISVHALHSQSRGPSWPVACGPCTACPLQDLRSWARSCKHTVSEKKSSGRQQAIPGELEGAPGALAVVPTETTHAVTQTMRLTRQPPSPRVEAAFRGALSPSQSQGKCPFSDLVTGG